MHLYISATQGKRITFNKTEIRQLKRAKTLMADLTAFDPSVNGDLDKVLERIDEETGEYKSEEMPF